ncbi:hypothetical protein NECAME_14499 [Necator americanus]|uniref:Protein SHQ1 homolog n=1 Tax=Necator americanus TaxID=51031 RepID=W2SMJ8_NECAM|nr:hypothetical protein NECAME_14499 [Necator americanus]ETN70850.1 hypothetical protein NECAME_14499 [Necator americanus]
MITPSFSIAQDDKLLVFTIRAPYAKIADTEIEYADDIFMFSAPPYYLRVHLPREVVDDNSGSANYDSTLGEFTVRVPKKNPGENFPGLDMITELLNPQRKISAQKLVEEIVDDADEDVEDDSEYFTEQKITDIRVACSDDSTGSCNYGFAWRRKGILGQLSKEIGGLVELPDPENCPIHERGIKCTEKDVKSFDPERYLLDFLDPEESLQHAIQSQFGLQLDIDAEDRKRLKDFPRKKLPKLSQEEQRLVAFSLIDIVFAFSYDSRINEWEYVDEAVIKALQEEVAEIQILINVIFAYEKVLMSLQVRKSDLELDLEELELEGRMAAMRVKEPQQLDSDDEPE